VGGKEPDRECRLCGRKGRRGFVLEKDGWRCTNDAACQEREAKRYRAEVGSRNA